MILFSGFAVIYEGEDDYEDREKRPTIGPFADSRMCLSPEVSSERRCKNKGKGSVFSGFAYFWNFLSFMQVKMITKIEKIGQQLVLLRIRECVFLEKFHLKGGA